MNILKKSLLVLAGAATLAIAGTANAAALKCVYEGPTSLTTPDRSNTIGCDFTVVVKIGCDGAPDYSFEIVSAGAVPGDASCSALFTGGLPWTGNLFGAGGISPGPGTINTANQIPFSVVDAAFSIDGGGVVSGVSSGVTTPYACDTATVQIPTSVTVADPTGGSPGNFGPVPGQTNYAIFTTTSPLDLVSCAVVQ